ncbi:MAG: hypothetical protein K6E61_07005 [Bacteroidales bacterium]|nr:hypothetical protein [Bacteroidales bacterium]
MKRHLIMAAVLLAAACVQEEAPLYEEITSSRYVNVGVSLDVEGDATKSVISSSAEAFSKAVLYAMNPSTGAILLYDSGAGDLSGTPVYTVTDSKNFSWPLPENVPMKVYCVTNPPGSFLESTHASGLTKSQLEAKMFSCTGSQQLRELGLSGGGLPMTGTLEIGAGDITSDNSSVSISVKNLFAKYRFSLDLSSLESGEKISVTKLSVMSGNTSVPYFGENYCQSSESLLSDFDYATPQQLSALAKGGENNGVDIYTLENCHGTHSGASHWWTVYKDLFPSWPEIAKCTSIQLCYSITSADGIVNSYTSRIFLGSGNMVDDFNVRRNLYKSITVKANRRTGETDPYFRFPSDTYFMAPGTEITVDYACNICEVAENDALEDIWVTDANGDPTSDIYVTWINPQNRQARVRASSGCTVGSQYWLNGGVQGDFYWPPYGTDAQEFSERRKIVLVPSRTLTFESPSTEIYPYVSVKYVSNERYSYNVALEMARTVRLTSVSDSADPSFTSVTVEPVGGEYAIQVTLVPARPGEIGFTATYGENDDVASSASVTVYEPVLKAFGDSNIDICGTAGSIEWKLMNRNCTRQLQAPEKEGTFRVSKRDPYGTDLTLTLSSSSETSRTYSVYLAGFGGLQGFDPENYTFSGVTVPIEASYTYPGGYSVNSVVNARIDNPLEGVSYDNRHFDYCVMQGKTEQPAFVSVNYGTYKVENMMEWPQRTFTVDLTRGGARACSGLETWTEHSGVTSLSSFAPAGGTVSLDEDLTVWGPVYYGKKITNFRSGETVRFIHSIIRMYCHYNVFATFDVQEKNRVRIDWDDQGNINWSPTIMILNYHFGSLKARLISNLTVLPQWEAAVSVLSTDITSSTRVKPILPGYTLLTSKNGLHGSYSSGAHDNYQLYHSPYYSYERTYMLGYYDRPANYGYDINYDWIYVDGLDDSFDYIYWRLIATCNKPWFKIVSGAHSSNGYYVTGVQKNAAGYYCFNVLNSSANQASYLDHEGLGYLRLHLWWEGKEGRVRVNSRDLHPATSYNASLCIVNGWYDPRPYSNGLPVLKEKVGTYFFPESSSTNTRSGYPPYYSDDWPFEDCTSFGSMEISSGSHLSFGDLYSRDANAPR